MSIVRINKTDNYSVIHNECLKNPLISWRAKGMYAYMMTLPNGWQIRRGEIFSHSTEGKDASNTAFNELISHGYIKKEYIREKGQIKGFEYILYESARSNVDQLDANNEEENTSKPFKSHRRTENPSTGKTVHRESRPSENPHLLNTNKKINTKNNKNKNNRDFDFSKNELCGSPKPNLNEIQNYISEKYYEVNAEEFFEYYEKYNWQFKGDSIDWKEKAKKWHIKNTSEKKDYRKMDKEQKQVAEEYSSMRARESINKQNQYKEFMDLITFYNATLERIQESLKFKTGSVTSKDKEILGKIAKAINRHSSIVRDDMLLTTLFFKDDNGNVYTPKVVNLKNLTRAAF